MRALPAWQFDAAAAAQGAGEAARHAAISRRSASTTRRLAIGAAGALLGYAGATQQSALAHVRTLAVETASEYLALDPATRRNLEITATLRRRAGAHAAVAARRLRARRPEAACCAQWLTHPLRDAGALPRRGTTRIAALRADDRARAARSPTRCAAPSTSSASSAASRCATRGRATSRDCATRSPRCPAMRAGAAAACDAPLVARARRKRSTSTRSGRALLARAIAPEPAAQVRDGGVIAAGLRRRARRAARDRRQLRRRSWSTSRRASARAPASPTSRSSTTACTASTSRSRNAHVEKIPDDYRRRQTLKNAERYITPELKAFEDQALSAQERALAREKLLFERCWRDLAPAIPALQSVGGGARARSTCSRLSPSAPTRSTSRVPHSSREPGIAIRGGRHPVVERQVDALHPERRRRCAARSPPARRHRPEHGRQVDVHAADRGDRAARVLRHRSCRRRSATIGPLDAIFTRIGAADDLAGGRSTFMVEMTEAAYILQSRDAAEPRADRRDRPRHVDVRRPGAGVGDRAPAGGEQPLPRAVRHALFRAHRACPRRSTAAPTCISTRSSTSDGIVFLHAVEDGPANRSYGLQVAKLAGVPAETIRQARAYLARLDQFSARSDAADRSVRGSAPPGTHEGDPRGSAACWSTSRARPRRAVAARSARRALRAQATGEELLTLASWLAAFLLAELERTSSITASCGKNASERSRGLNDGASRIGETLSVVDRGIVRAWRSALGCSVPEFGQAPEPDVRAALEPIPVAFLQSAVQRFQ